MEVRHWIAEPHRTTASVLAFLFPSLPYNITCSTTAFGPTDPVWLSPVLTSADSSTHASALCRQQRCVRVAADLDHHGVMPPWKDGKLSAVAVLRIRKRHVVGIPPKVEDCLQGCCSQSRPGKFIVYNMREFPFPVRYLDFASSQAIGIVIGIRRQLHNHLFGGRRVNFNIASYGLNMPQMFLAIWILL